MVRGIVRNLDELGRVTLPKEMRRTLKINEKDPVDIYFKDGIICIEPFKLKCVDCGSTEEEKLMDINGVLHCRSCAVDMAQDMKKYGLL